MKRVPSSRRDITGILFSNILDILRYIFGERKCNGLQYGRRHFWEGRRPSVCSSLQACGGLHVARVPTCVEEGASTVSTEGRYLRNVNTGGGDDNATSGPEASVKKRTNPFELAVLMKN